MQPKLYQRKWNTNRSIDSPIKNPKHFTRRQESQICKYTHITKKIFILRTEIDDKKKRQKSEKKSWKK